MLDVTAVKHLFSPELVEKCIEGQVTALICFAVVWVAPNYTMAGGGPCEKS